jgi:ABC-type dipeptide/oligopeptide/nickel transport system permease subunit
MLRRGEVDIIDISRERMAEVKRAGFDSVLRQDEAMLNIWLIQHWEANVPVHDKRVGEAMNIAIVVWGHYARVIRGEVLSLKARDFVAQAWITGCSGLRIIVVHHLPNTLNTLIILLTLQIGYVILVEASLSFLGAGIPPPTPAWGSMMSEARD